MDRGTRQEKGLFIPCLKRERKEMGGRLGGGNLNSFLAASAFSVKEEARSSRESGKPERASATPAA